MISLHYILIILFCINCCFNCDKSTPVQSDSQNALNSSADSYEGEGQSQKSNQRSKTGSDETYQSLQTLSKITANFSLEFLKLLKAEGKIDENLFISPASIVTLLAMLYDGSDKNTRKQINDVVFNGADEATINKAVKNFTESVKLLNEANGVTLTSANKIYCSKNGNSNESYVNVLRDNFHAPFENVDFQTKTEKVRTQINEWVSSHTNNKIQELFESGTITSATSMALVNAIFFQGSWTYQFDSTNTSQSKFYINDKNQSVDVQMMTQLNTNFLYYRNWDIKVLGLPYGNKQFIMYIILPAKRFGLDKIEKSLNDTALLNLISKAKNRGYITTLSLPKFKLEKPYDLSKVFTSMGMTDMFDQAVADFSKIDSEKRQFVSAAIHKAFIEVNEEGTKAGAASGAASDFRLLPEEVQFEVNEPFLFLISDTKTGNILFFGRVSTL